MSPEISKQLAAILRRLADDLDSGRMPAGLGVTSAPPPPTLERADALIRREPGLTGQELADELRVSHDHFRRDIAPKLRARGFRARRGAGGYFPPAGSIVGLPHNEPHNAPTAGTDLPR